MTKKEYKALQERYYKATCILLDIEKMKENILKLEDDKLFDNGGHSSTSYNKFLWLLSSYDIL